MTRTAKATRTIFGWCNDGHCQPTEDSRGCPGTIALPTDEIVACQHECHTEGKEAEAA